MARRRVHLLPDTSGAEVHIDDDGPASRRTSSSRCSVRFFALRRRAVAIRAALAWGLRSRDPSFFAQGGTLHLENRAWRWVRAVLRVARGRQQR